MSLNKRYAIRNNFKYVITALNIEFCDFLTGNWCVSLIITVYYIMKGWDPKVTLHFRVKYR